MRVRQRPVQAIKLGRPVRFGMPGNDVESEPNDWLVIDDFGNMQLYRHAHFMKAFEPEDSEARELWAEHGV